MPRNALFPESNEETEALSAKMMDAWISFARSGNPNHKDIPDWSSCPLCRDRNRLFLLEPLSSSD